MHVVLESECTNMQAEEEEDNNAVCQVMRQVQRQHQTQLDMKSKVFHNLAVNGNLEQRSTG